MSALAAAIVRLIRTLHEFFPDFRFESGEYSDRSRAGQKRPAQGKRRKREPVTPLFHQEVPPSGGLADWKTYASIATPFHR